MHYVDMKLKKLIPIMLEEQYLYEGLIITQPIGTTMGMVDRWFDNMSANKNIKTKNTFYVDIINIDDGKWDHLNKFMNNMGWFPAAYSIDLSSQENYNKYNEDELRNIISKKLKFIRVFFYAKYDIIVDNYDLPNEMYHVTPFNKVEKILKNGLAPKSKDKIATLPNRIYLLKYVEDVPTLLKNKRFINDNVEFGLLKIDVKLLKEQSAIKFLEDPEFENKAIYTYENIHPRYIDFVDKISINKTGK